MWNTFVHSSLILFFIYQFEDREFILRGYIYLQSVGLESHCGFRNFRFSFSYKMTADLS